MFEYIFKIEERAKMDDKDRKMTMKKLEIQLGRTKTQEKKQYCFRFFVTENEKNVRLSEQDYLDIEQENPSGNFLDKDQASQLIVDEAQNEEDNLQSLKKAIQNAKAAMSTLEESIKGRLIEVKEEFQRSWERFVSEYSNKFGTLISNIDNVDFAMKLDEAFPKLAKQRRNPKDMETMADFKDKTEEIREKSQMVLLKIDPKRVWEEKSKEIKKFNSESVKEIERAQGKGKICRDERGGISVDPRNPSQFLTLSKNGPLVLFDEEKQTTKEIQLEAKEKTYMDSVSFSPKGSHFLVSVFQDSKVHVFESKKLNEGPIQSWNRKESYKKVFAKWVDNRKIVACYLRPGALEVLRLGSKEPIIKINPVSLTGYDQFDLDVSKTHAVCSGFLERENSKNVPYLFKVDITKMQKAPAWKHQKHQKLINTIKIFNKGDFVISGGDGDMLMATGMSNGDIIFKIDGAGKAFQTIAFTPDEKVVVIQKFASVSLFSCEKAPNGSFALNKIDSIKHNRVGGGSLNFSMSLVLDYSLKSNDHFLLIGKKDGRIFKVKLN